MSTHNNNFTKRRLHQVVCQILRTPAASISAVVLASALMSAPAMARDSAIKGKVETQAANVSVSGVTVTASSNVMPKPRTVQTKADGSYVLPALKPGTYTLTFTSADGSVREMMVDVLLDQTAKVDVAFEAAPTGSTEVIQIVGARISREGDSSLSGSLGKDVLDRVPAGQDYRSLLAIIPGVQYSENSTLGPSAGGSGRDNKYGFDGVDVSLPMYGNLASEPSTQDVAFVSIDRGGAKAIGFNRAGGMSINTMSKSGTNDFHASVEYRIEPKGLVADKKTTDSSTLSYKENKTWMSANVSGALLEDELFFYGSYFGPEVTRDNKETAYGPVKEYKSSRDEFFSKFTWAPTDDLLLNLSYRTSDKEVEGDSVSSKATDSTSEGSTVTQDILTFDGSYILSDSTILSFQFSDFENKNSGRPDTVFSGVNPSLGGSLDLDNLDQLGNFYVPSLKDDAGYDNVEAQALIDAYGYETDGVKTGGGNVGGGSSFNNQDFYRKSFELKLDHEMDIGDTFHSIHLGYQWKESKEVLTRLSNGWGGISYVGGLNTDTDFVSTTPIYYSASVYSNSLLSDELSPLTSSSETINIEVNDTIEYNDFTFNVGFLFSNDVLYGQGLKETAKTEAIPATPDTPAIAENVSGYVVAPGEKYKMYELDFVDMIQPRLGITWAYTEDSTVFANYASYNPDTTSLARAASWDRNNQSTQEVYFDENGDFIGNTEAGGSSGKLFQDDLKARRTDEFTIGMTQYVSNELFIRTHWRQRKALHAWEDTPNDSRLYDYTDIDGGPFGGVPANIAAKGLYIEDLDAYRAEIGGGSYVIAELDGAENTYYEWSIEGDYTGENFYLNMSYVWSHYFGNYDQDITSTASDGNLFVGSSNLADGIGRQLWDGKYGKLNGDRPHILKALGYYTTDWEADIGFNFVFQSGDVWEAWDGSLYGYSSDTIRYAESAGSRREASHWQLDLNYAQSFDLNEDFVLKFKADIYNVFDKQTGYNYNPIVSSETFGEAQTLINPRRVQFSVSIDF
ncbi:carboxypeptidase regulatory-like domain-containing protein [uncultured Psychrosphaera sp.]|uniref:TonB-dependent receptor n=1 Tax=uncultured Psychrosphaera sp. TaxID=1403522 RepID=UPI0026102817|nr:carboxypeptidase regulatory-like domain-containing protein [uncultured Psychrosphaera sp.]